MTMQLIESKTIGTAVSTVQFVSIPQSFTDLVLLISARDNATNGTLYIEFNTVGSGYTFRNLDGNGSSASSTNTSSSNIFWPMTGTNQTANTFGNSAVYIPNYTGSTNKSVSINTVTENNATEAFQQIIAGLWSNTAAITSIKFYSNTSFVVGSVLSLYGITKGSDGIVTTS